MAYDNDAAWVDLDSAAARDGNRAIVTLNLLLEAYNNWQTFRAGRTNANIATDLGKTESDIAAMDAAYSGFKHVHDAASGVDTGIVDCFYGWRRFVL